MLNKELYLKRIKYSGSQQPTLEVLCNLQKSHLLSVPFENLDIHSGVPIELNPEKFFNKIVLNNRGGFCYELNGLFYELLVSMGFKAKRISARVYDKEKGYGKEYDHLAIVVNLNDKEYLSDVGFGEFTFYPLEIKMRLLQNDPRGVYFIDKYDLEYYRVCKKEDDEIIPQYIFKNAERQLSEFTDMCHYHQTSPDSHFTQKRLISIPTLKGRITITGKSLKIKEDNTITETELESEEIFNQKLLEFFTKRIEQ